MTKQDEIDELKAEVARLEERLTDACLTIFEKMKISPSLENWWEENKDEGDYAQSPVVEKRISKRKYWAQLGVDAKTVLRESVEWDDAELADAIACADDSPESEPPQIEPSESERGP